MTVTEGGAPASDVTVVHLVDGGDPEPCSESPEDTFICGWERTGLFAIVVLRGDERVGSALVRVEEDESGCHPDSQSVEIELAAP